MMDIIEKLKDEGFKGFVRVEELMHNPKLPEDEKGVYVVLYTTGTYPFFCKWELVDSSKTKIPMCRLKNLKRTGLTASR